MGFSIAVAGSRQVIEIRRTAANGFESVKRRVIGSGTMRPAAPTVQEIIRNKSPIAQPKSARSSRHKAGTRKRAPLAGTSVEQESPPLDALIEQIPPTPKSPIEQIVIPQEGEIQSPKVQAPEHQIDREALGAKLWASFTPHPIPGARGLLATSQRSGTHGEPNPSLNTVTTLLKPLVNEPASPKLHNIMSSKFDRPENRIKPSLKCLGNGSRRLSSDTHGGQSHLQNRRSLPELSELESHGSCTRSQSISETPKRVRFVMNETNGLPQEYSVKFYKDSKIGEWAPSSPWADDQFLACTSDLKYNLEALLREDSWLPPPSTPILNRPESYDSGENSSSFLEENLPSSPPGNESPPNLSASSISDSSPMSVDIIENSDQHMIDEHPMDESPVIQAAITSSPYLRIRELVKGSFRKVFSSPRATPSDTINKRPSQGTIEVSMKDHDTSPQMSDLNHSLPPFGPPKVLDYAPSSSKEGMEHATNGNESKLGLVDSPIGIGGDDIGQYPLVGDSSGGSAGYSSGPDGSNDSYLTPQKEEAPADAELELIMGKLKMSTYSRKKLERIRKQNEAVAAARKAAEEAATAKAKADAEEAERKARSHRRMPKEKLVKPLSKDWEARIREAVGRGDNAALTTTVTGTELRRKDFMTVLGEKQWLNDEIINAYLEWVVEYANKKAGKDGRNAIPKVVAHNSFFYKNISTNGPKSVSRWMKRKKAEGKKLLEVETVLIPVNNASHWTIIVVSPKERTIEYLDSFSGASKVFINNTKGWLAEELGSDWKEEEWRVLETKSAVQNNGYDCGVFCITNAECVAGGVDTASYDGSDMACQRQRIAGVLLNRGFGGDFVPAEDL